jgi:hypothetical protein
MAGEQHGHGMLCVNRPLRSDVLYCRHKPPPKAPRPSAAQTPPASRRPKQRRLPPPRAPRPSAAHSTASFRRPKHRVLPPPKAPRLSAAQSTASFRRQCTARHMPALCHSLEGGFTSNIRQYSRRGGQIIFYSTYEYSNNNIMKATYNNSYSTTNTTTTTTLQPQNIYGHNQNYVF